MILWGGNVHDSKHYAPIIIRGMNEKFRIMICAEEYLGANSSANLNFYHDLRRGSHRWKPSSSVAAAPARSPPGRAFRQERAEARRLSPIC